MSVEHPSGGLAQPTPRGWRWGRVTLRAAAVLGVAGASFMIGRSAAGWRGLPEIAATLLGDQTEFRGEMDARIRERFPVGTSEDRLIDYLAAEGFVPGWRRRDAANEAEFTRDGVLCKKIVRVFWRADMSGNLADVGGAFDTHCL